MAPHRALVEDVEQAWAAEAAADDGDGGVQPAQEPGRRLLMLTSCSELFNTDGRLVAFGHLERTVRRR